jgi:hypothetical protein
MISGNGIHDAMIEVLTVPKPVVTIRDTAHKVREFVAQHVPELPPDAADGFYSPAHAMEQAARFMEEFAAQTIMRSAADTIKRLATHAERTKNINVYTSGKRRKQEVTLPGVTELTAAWKMSPAGREFRQLLENISHHILTSDPIIDDTVHDISRAIDLIITAKDEMPDVNAKIANQFPRAVVLILINLSLLLAEAKRHSGEPLPTSRDNLHNLRLVQGLFNYNEKAEIERINKPESSEKNVPYIVEQPRVLKV